MEEEPNWKRRAAPRKGRAPAKKRKPVRFSAKVAEEICIRIAAGETWSAMCGKGSMPSHAALYKWRDQKPEFRADLERARDIAADSRADRALEVAEGATSATVQADRLRVSTLLWHAARGAPHRYGSRAEAPAGKAPRASFSVRIREFVPVTREDGTVFTREIRPDGSFVDADG